MKRINGLALAVVLLAWTIGAPIVCGQGKTRVELNSIGNSELQNVAEDNASAVITELNRAETFDRPPNLSDLPVTDWAQENIMSRWKEAPFFCNRTKLSLSLEPQGNETYEIREIPLMVEEERRNAIVTLHAEGEVIGFRFSNEPATGTITIVSEPSGAIVESGVRDSTPQTAPVQFKNIPEGEYAFTIRKESYQKVDTTLSVKAHRSIKKTIQLRPTFGYVRVKGGAETIQVDGAERSPSENGRIQVDAGKHVVTLSRQYYQPYDTTLTVAPGETGVVSAEFQRKRVPVRVFSNPTGATVTIDGDSAGTTPLLTKREAGRAYALRVDAERHVPSKRMNIFAEPDTVIEREVTLSPIKIQVEDRGVSIEDVHAERSERLVTITYDLLGKPDESYEVKLSMIDRNGESVEIDPDVVSGAIGEKVTSGLNKKIYWREELPEGATMQLTQGPPSVATSLTVGYFATDFQLEGGGESSPYDFDRPLKTVMITGKAGLLSVGYDKFSVTQGDHWVFSTILQLGGNVHIFKNKRHSFLVYIPFRFQGNYVYSGISMDSDEESSNKNILNIGFGSGLGGRLRVGRFRGVRGIPVLNKLVVDGSLMFVPSGYFGIQNEIFDGGHVGRTRHLSIELKLLDLIDTGAGRGIGVTFGFTRRTLSRSSDQPSSFGEVLDSAFAPWNLERISTEQLFRVGINWQ